MIAALVTFATPYAIFIFQEYGRSIPIELDESARIDGASPLQIYLRIYLPLMAPALVAVGTYALLLAWNEYLYQFLLLSDKRSMTVPVALAQFLNSDVAPWNYMMATAIIYALPPIAIYYVFRAPHELRPDHGRRQGLSRRRRCPWRKPHPGWHEQRSVMLMREDRVLDPAPRRPGVDLGHEPKVSYRAHLFRNALR